MASLEEEKLTLPALRGVMGNWVYYACLIGFDDLAKRVRFADEIHRSDKLSDMIQRQLKRNRGRDIARYLELQNDRFFNSLVVATYGGNPNWHPISNVSPDSPNSSLPDLTVEIMNSVGFLTLTGTEKLFAIDGQHRLSGIKNIVKNGPRQDPWDEVSVIFVAHKDTDKGKERTRRLFTVLNKTARPVSPGDIIALDEDDVMAITTRRLIEETDFFSGNRIAFVPTNNMPSKNVESLTTIGNLYKILTIIFTSSAHELAKPKGDLTRIRPSDEVLERYFSLALQWFEGMAKHFPEIQQFFEAENYGDVTKMHRGTVAGSVLYRPIGLEIFVTVIVHLTKKKLPLDEAMQLASQLPRKITNEPFAHTLWNPSTKTMNTKQHLVTLREILLNMLGHSKQSDTQLLDRYRKATGNNTADLPVL